MTEYSWLIDDIETLSTYTKDLYTKAVLNRAAKAIRKLSADVVPVRHGRWEFEGKPISLDENGCPAGPCFCSVCGDWLTASDEYATRGRYCPNCGAKMDGGEA